MSAQRPQDSPDAVLEVPLPLEQVAALLAGYVEEGNPFWPLRKDMKVYYGKVRNDGFMLYPTAMTMSAKPCVGAFYGTIERSTEGSHVAWSYRSNPQVNACYRVLLGLLAVVFMIMMAGTGFALDFVIPQALAAILIVGIVVLQKQRMSRIRQRAQARLKEILLQGKSVPAAKKS